MAGHRRLHQPRLSAQLQVCGDWPGQSMRQGESRRFKPLTAVGSAETESDYILTDLNNLNTILNKSIFKLKFEEKHLVDTVIL